MQVIRQIHINYLTLKSLSNPNLEEKKVKLTFLYIQLTRKCKPYAFYATLVASKLKVLKCVKMNTSDMMYRGWLLLIQPFFTKCTPNFKKSLELLFYPSPLLILSSFPSHTHTPIFFLFLSNSSFIPYSFLLFLFGPPIAMHAIV